MDFSFSESQQKLKKDVHDFFLNELPEDYDGEVYAIGQQVQAFHVELQKKAAKEGWFTPGWPKVYGGGGLSEIEQAIIDEEIGYWGIYWPNFIGVHIAGPALIEFGTEEQKKRFLPSIVKGEGIWYQAMTEPDAGTDIANVKLRATESGENFVLNGQKTFITGGYKPDYLYTLARTADTTPKHRGLTIFLVPADTPGISYRALPCMGGVRTNEIFFDDIKVSKEYMLGELNKGFYHSMATFEHERASTRHFSQDRRNLEVFIQYCRETEHDGKSLIEDPQIKEILAQMVIENEIWRLCAWRTVWRFSKRQDLGPLDYDLDGYWWKTFAVSHCETMMKIMGLYGQLQRGSKWARIRGSIERRWQDTRSLHGAGTLEMYKIVLAERVLGLPRKK